MVLVEGIEKAISLIYESVDLVTVHIDRYNKSLCLPVQINIFKNEEELNALYFFL